MPCFRQDGRQWPRIVHGLRLECREMMNHSLAPGSIPDGHRVYAVGDVHGCVDQLDDLHRSILADLRARPVTHAYLVHLGDYIDRGPSSAEVLERLIAGVTGWTGHPEINLLGNHEAMLQDALGGDRNLAGHWLANGGVAALESWRVPPRTAPRDWPKIIPRSHIAFIDALPLFFELGDYLFVHAGVRPGVALSAQTRQDMLWIREPFLSFTGRLPTVVVHGHTPEEAQPVVRPHRIGIDTGAVLGGPLTCVVLESNRMGFLQA